MPEHVVNSNARKCPPEGPLTAKIAFIGEAPGTTEIQLQRPFVGSSGQLLSQLMQRAGILRGECYFTNVVKEQPPQNDISHFISFGRVVKATPSYTAYENQLYEELRAVKANVLVPLGNTPLYALTRLQAVTKRRGSILETRCSCAELNGRKIIPTIHPAAALRNYLFTYPILSDLMRIKEHSNYAELGIPSRRLRIAPSYQDSLDFLNRMLAEKKPTAFDIEVVNLEVSCISFCNDPADVISIPFIEDGRDYFDPEQEAAIWLKIAELLETPWIPKIGQNINFDSDFLFRRYGIRVNPKDDTMVAQAYVSPELPKGLDFITSIYTSEPYYKDEGKKHFKVGGEYRTFWAYNAKDSAVCLEALTPLISEVKKLGNYQPYRRQVDLIDPLLYMQEHGILCDVSGLKAASEDAEVKIKDLTAELHKLCGYPLNVSSPKQMCNFFYSVRGYKPILNRKTGGITTDAKALKKLSMKGSPEAKLLLQIRKLEKMKGTYYDISVDSDSRLRCMFNPVGTVSGRLSSSKTIFDTGGNFQNIPDNVRRYMLADNGYIMYNLDLSQAENRTVAYIAPDLNMIRAFEDGIDIHRQTASLIFKKPMSEISDEAGSSSIGGGVYSERFWGKKANHCELGSAEVLTETGWCRLDQYDWTTTKMAQWDRDGKITFVFPTEMFQAKYSGQMYKFENTFIHQLITPEHRIPIFRMDNGEFKTVKAHEFRDTWNRWRWPVAGTYALQPDSISLFTPDEMRLIVAIQADCALQSSGVVFKASKERKLERFGMLLTRLNLKYTVTLGGYYIAESNPLVKRIRETLTMRKLFGPWLLQCSQESLAAFVSELPKWDGHQRHWQYFTTVEQNAIWAQIAATLANQKTTYHMRDNVNGFGDKPLHFVRFASGSATSCRGVSINTTDVIDTDIYCPTVPSGFFVCRSNNKVCITGNSLNYDFGYKSFAALYDIPEADAKFLVESYHSAYPGVRQYHAWVRAQLSKDRTLEDCFGRRRRFLERWGDALFKEAYSFIPQGTVATKINLALLEIYGNQYLYSPVELLTLVHDSISFQIPLSRSWETHAAILIAMRDFLESPITWKTTDFIIPADCKTGPNLRDMWKVDWHRYETKQDLAEFLRQSYEKSLTKEVQLEPDEVPEDDIENDADDSEAKLEPEIGE